jgi:integrase
MGTIDEHLAYCALRELRPTYIAEMRMTLRRLERVVGELEHATEAQIESWWESLTVGPGSRAAYAAHVSSFYRWLVRYRHRDDDPTERLVRPRLHRGLPRPIAEHQLSHALELALPPLGAWLALAGYMGLRAHEIASLHGEDIRGDRLLIRDGKGGRQRIVPMHQEVARLLVGCPRIGPVFVNGKGGRLIANSVSQRTNRYLHSLGYPETIHQARHLFGTMVYRISRDLRLTQELMGHASPLTTAGYAAWDSEAAAGVIAQLTLDGAA